MSESSTTRRGATEDTPEDRKEFGLPSLTMLVIASMVGFGVFTTSGYTLGSVGTPLRVVLCWAMGGAIAVCGAISYGRLAQIIPESGGEYLYLSRHVHPFAGFLAGWVSLTAGFSGAIATVAVAFERYALPDSIRPAWLSADVAAISLIVFFGFLHGRFRTVGKRFHNTVVMIKLLALTAFVLVGLVQLPSHQWHWVSTLQRPEGINLLTAMATSVVWISLSYAGFNAAVYVASESRAAQRNVPRALLWGTLLVTAFYLIFNFVFVTAAAAPELIWKEDIAAIAARHLGGNWLEGLVRLAIVLGLMTSASSMIISGPRVYARMADDGVFPQLFRVQDNGISRSVALQSVLAIGLIVLQRLLVEAEVLKSSLLGLLDYLGTTLSISSALCVATLFLPAVRTKDTHRPAWVSFAAATYVICTLVAIVLLVMNHKVEGQPQGLWHLLGALSTAVTGTIAWFFMRRKISDK